jgi:5-hydroxyisourate hydrolase-like protein (transthyretin family)
MRFTRPHVNSLIAVALLVAGVGCNEATSAFPLGKLSAQVVDAANAPVQGVAADLYKLIDGSPVLWRESSTSGDGIAVFGATDGGVVTGDYYVHVSFINGYQLASGETNDKTVTVTDGSDNVVTFHAVSTGPTH